MGNSLASCRPASVEEVVCLHMLINFLRLDSHLYFPRHVQSLDNHSHSTVVCLQAIDMKLLNGYGLTETSPVVASRRLNFNVRNTI